jgi:hypothetical protein
LVIIKSRLTVINQIVLRGEMKMENLIITRKGNAISVYSKFSNQTFKGKFDENGILRGKALDVRMIGKALKLEGGK